MFESSDVSRYCSRNVERHWSLKFAHMIFEGGVLCVCLAVYETSEADSPEVIIQRHSQLIEEFVVNSCEVRERSSCINCRLTLVIDVCICVWCCTSSGRVCLA